MPRFSVIIPCYHDEDKLADLLRQLQQLPDSSLETIVVDGARDRHAAEYVSSMGRSGWRPNLAVDNNYAWALQRCDALWFLHADNRLPPDPLSAMQLAFDQGAVGGYFRLFRSSSRLARAAAGTSNRLPLPVRGALW